MEEINKTELFEALQKTSIQVNKIFRQINHLRKAIKDKCLIIEETKKLELLFDEFDFSMNNSEGKLSENFRNKINAFFDTPNLNMGRQLSRGQFNFFESVYDNPEYFGEIESNLSKVRKKCEVCWYGILQSYGKILITA